MPPSRPIRKKPDHKPSHDAAAHPAPTANFFRQVYDLVARIPPGKVMTYGQIARRLGGFHSGRVVGFAMRVAPAERGLPCHRVVNIKGEMAPGLIFGGEARQRRLLREEGVRFKRDGRINLEKSLLLFDEAEKIKE